MASLPKALGKTEIRAVFIRPGPSPFSQHAKAKGETELTDTTLVSLFVARLFEQAEIPNKVSSNKADLGVSRAEPPELITHTGDTDESIDLVLRQGTGTARVSRFSPISSNSHG